MFVLSVGIRGGPDDGIRLHCLVNYMLYCSCLVSRLSAVMGGYHNVSLTAMVIVVVWVRYLSNTS